MFRTEGRGIRLCLVIPQTAAIGSFNGKPKASASGVGRVPSPPTPSACRSGSEGTNGSTLSLGVFKTQSLKTGPEIFTRRALSMPPAIG